MSWQQDQNYGGYSNYGDYSEGQTDAAIDMFDDGSSNPQKPYQEPVAESNSFYDPKFAQNALRISLKKSLILFTLLLTARKEI